MANKELYNSITNPLKDESVIRDLINAYAEENDLYYYLTHHHVKDKQNQIWYDQEIRDEFYSKLFKIWKENVLSLTETQVNRIAQHDKKIEQDYNQLKTFLKTLPEIKNKNEFMNLINSNVLIQEYGWQSSGRISGWINILAPDLMPGKDDEYYVEHRLYLNTDSADTEAVASMFLDKCMENNIPFYFKYADFGDRDDTIVIYSDTEHLEQYVSILQELKKENTELFSRMHQPPILTGKIDGWIGYGSEPQCLLDGSRTSFNELRSVVIANSIRKATTKWIYEHQNDLIMYKGKNISVSEYLSTELTDKIMSECEKMTPKDVQRNAAQQSYNMYGLVPNDFTSGNLRQTIQNYSDQNIQSIISNVHNKQNLDNKMTIPTRDGKEFSITKYELNSIYARATKQILKNDPTFFQTVKATIISESKPAEIDTDKYCFDLAPRDELFSYAEQIDSPQPSLMPDPITPETGSGLIDESFVPSGSLAALKKASRELKASKNFANNSAVFHEFSIAGSVQDPIVQVDNYQAAKITASTRHRYR